MFHINFKGKGKKRLQLDKKLLHTVKVSMGKNNCWFTYVKRVFLPESKTQSEEELKKRIWFFDIFKTKKHGALQAPQTTLNEATEEQRKRTFAVAIVTAAAAEAAVAAANAAAEVVWLTNIPYEVERKNKYSSAVKIQKAYRGHLARKALSALKGIVKLQAVVRGELVRKSVIEKLTSMALFTKPKSQVHQKRVSNLLDYLNDDETRHSLIPEERSKSHELKLQCSSRTGWDLSVVSEEGSEAFCLRKKEAIAKRERIKQYSYSHRERRNHQNLQEPISHKENRKSRRFDQCLELKLRQPEENERHKRLSLSKTIAVDHISQLSQLKLKTARKHEMIDESNSPFLLSRRSFCHVKQKSTGDESSLPNSPFFPAYMASTESAKAKFRSLSTPRQRFRLYDTYSGHDSPYKFKVSTWSLFNGEMIEDTKRNSISKQISESSTC